MHALVEVIFALVCTGIAAGGLTLGLVTRRLRRTNRLVADRRSPAPMSWRWSPRRSALLHRRLRRSCELIVAVLRSGEDRSLRPRRFGRRRSAPSSVLEVAGRELLERAVAADACLAGLEVHGAAWRRLHLPAVAAEVSAIEAAALRLVQLDEELRHQSRSVDPAGGPVRAELLLDAFEAALAELRPLDGDVRAQG